MAELTKRYVVMSLATEAPFDLRDPDGPFVLKPWKDPAALRALEAYRDHCYPELARDLDAWIRAIKAGPAGRGGGGGRAGRDRAGGGTDLPVPAPRRVHGRGGEHRIRDPRFPKPRRRVGPLRPRRVHLPELRGERRGAPEVLAARPPHLPRHQERRAQPGPLRDRRSPPPGAAGW